jgi:hypothetical protein
MNNVKRRIVKTAATSTTNVHGLSGSSVDICRIKHYVINLIKGQKSLGATSAR